MDVRWRIATPRARWLWRRALDAYRRRYIYRYAAFGPRSSRRLGRSEAQAYRIQAIARERARLRRQGRSTLFVDRRLGRAQARYHRLGRLGY